MQNRQERTIVSFDKIEAYLDFEQRHTPEPPLLKEQRAKLATSRQRLRELQSIQIGASDRARGKARRMAQDLRRRHMMPLVRIAKPLFKFAPDAERVFKVPHARASASAIATRGLEMAKLIEPHAALLESAGYPDGFLAQFTKEARALADAAKTTELGRAERSQVTRDIAAELKSAMETVTVIEGLVMLHHGNSAQARKFWKERRKVGARIGRPPKKKNGGLPPS
jgi:hypothetical protein